MLQFGVTTVNNDAVARKVSRREKRKAHDVIPMQMGHEHMVSLGLAGPETAHHLRPERPHPAAHIAQHMLGPVALDLHATGMPAKGAGSRKTKAIDEGVDFVRAIQHGPGLLRLIQRVKELVAHLPRGQRNRQRAPRAPEVHPHAARRRKAVGRRVLVCITGSGMPSQARPEVAKRKKFRCHSGGVQPA